MIPATIVVLQPACCACPPAGGYIQPSPALAGTAAYVSTSACFWCSRALDSWQCRYSGWACLAGEQALTLLLSPEGEFVREILLDELAKGLDAYWRLAADESSVGLRQRVLALLGVRAHSSGPACSCSRNKSWFGMPVSAD